jgi:hypothetical protein
MAADRFASLTRALAAAGSRRRALAALAGALGLFGLAHPEEADAGKRNGGAPCTKGRQCKTGKCVGDPGQKVCTCSKKYRKCTMPDTTCQGGTCTDPNACSNPATTCEHANCGPTGTTCMCVPRVGSPGAVCIDESTTPNVPCLSETTGGCETPGMVCIDLRACNFPSPLCMRTCV